MSLAAKGLRILRKSLGALDLTRPGLPEGATPQKCCLNSGSILLVKYCNQHENIVSLCTGGVDTSVQKWVGWGLGV